MQAVQSGQLTGRHALISIQHVGLPFIIRPIYCYDEWNKGMHSRTLTDCCEWKCRFYWYKYLYVVGVNYSRHFAMWVHSCLWIWWVQHGRIYQMELRIPCSRNSAASCVSYLIINPVMLYRIGSGDFWENLWHISYSVCWPYTWIASFM